MAATAMLMAFIFVSTAFADPVTYTHTGLAFDRFGAGGECLELPISVSL
jgi:hypothetical protein